MAHIQRRARGRSVSYRVRYTDDAGVERSRSFGRKVDAESFLIETSHRLRSGTYVDPGAGRQTVEAYLEDWRAQQAHHRAKTAASTRTRFRTMVYPYVGDLALANVKPSTVRTWQRQLLDAGYAASTIRGVRGVLAGAFRDAVLDRLILSSPFDGVKAPEIIREQVVPRTIAQVLAGEAAMPDRYRAVIRVAAGTGMRFNELFGLTADRIDFLRRTVRVDRQLVGRVGPDAVFGPPKTRASSRVIPLAEDTVDVLADHLRRYPSAPGELVFRTSRGTPMTRTVWLKAWPEARAAMGLREGEGLHQLRHFYASLLIADGRSPIEVQQRLGHASAQETLDTYSHLWPDHADGTRNAIDRAFARPVPDAAIDL